MYMTQPDLDGMSNSQSAQLNIMTSSLYQQIRDGGLYEGQPGQGCEVKLCAQAFRDGFLWAVLIWKKLPYDVIVL